MGLGLMRAKVLAFLVTALLLSDFTAVRPVLAQVDTTFLSTLRSAIPEGADVSTGRVSASPEGVSVADLTVNFAIPYLPQGVKASPTFQGIEELRIGKLTVQGLEPGSTHVRQIVIENQTTKMAPATTVRTAEIKAANISFADLLASFFRGAGASPISDAGPIELRDMRIEGLNNAVLSIEQGSTGPTVGGILRDAVIGGFTYTGPEGSFRIGRMELPRYDTRYLTSLREMVSSAAGGEAQEMTTGEALTIVGSLLEAMPALTLRDMRFNPVRPGTVPFEVAQLGYAIEDGKEARPFSFEVTGMTVAAASVPELGVALPSLANKPLRADLRLVGRWDNAARRLVIEPLRMAVADAATVELTAELGSVLAMEAFGALPPDQAGQVLALTPLRRAKLTLEDDGAIDEYMARTAQQQGANRQSLAESFVTMANLLLNKGTAATPGPDGRLKDALASLRAFLNEPGTLTWQFEPKDPQPLALIGVMAAEKPAVLLELGKLDYTPPSP